MLAALGSRRVLLVVLALCLRTTVGFAETPNSAISDLDREAREAFARHDYGHAAEIFARAFRARPHPGYKYNEGYAWDKAGEAARAADAYEMALAHGDLDAERTRAIQTRLALLSQMLVRVQVTCPLDATISVAHVRNAPVPARFHLAPGSYTVFVSTRRGSLQRALLARAGETIVLDLPCDAAAPKREAKPEPTAQDSRTSSSPSPAPWIAFGVAAIFTGAAVYFGLRTVDAHDRFNASGDTDAKARSDGITYRALTNVGIAGAVVSTGVGVWLLAVDGSHSRDRPSASASARNLNLALKLRW